MATMNELISARIFLERNFPQGGRVLCAVSGGLDSMCLLDFVCRQEGLSVAAAHFNHQLRGKNADRDEAFVREYCRQRGIPCFSGRGDTRALAEAEGLSLEEAARNLRYAFLEETAEREGFAAILTAHHADDNAETMLLNLIRGTGSAGLAGIPRIRGRIYRPFLTISRERLAAYAAAHDLPHVEDETNEEEDAARNVLRRRVMPVLRELNSGAVENMSHAAGILSRENRAMEQLTEEFARQMVQKGDSLSISWAALLEAPLAVAERTVLQMLSAAAGCRKDLTAAHVEAVLELTDRGSVDLPYGLTARREGNELIVLRRESGGERELLPGEPVEWKNWVLTLLRASDGEGISLRGGWKRLRVSGCGGGERLTLPGTNGGGRTVKRLCLDRHISLAERAELPAIYADECLAAVWPLGTDEAWRPEAGEPAWFVQIKKKNGG